MFVWVLRCHRQKSCQEISCRGRIIRLPLVAHLGGSCSPCPAAPTPLGGFSNPASETKCWRNSLKNAHFSVGQDVADRIDFGPNDGRPNARSFFSNFYTSILKRIYRVRPIFCHMLFVYQHLMNENHPFLSFPPEQRCLLHVIPDISNRLEQKFPSDISEIRYKI